MEINHGNALENINNPLSSERYSRQILLNQIGMEGQEKIRAKHVLQIGAGALGTANAEALVRAGIGKLTIVDRDYVEFSNLQRQQLFKEEDAINTLPKAIAAKKHLNAINSETLIEAIILDVTAEDMDTLAEDVDVILDATDNFDTRMMINDVSQKRSIPWVYGACVGTTGVVYPILPKASPCLHCILERMPSNFGTCDTIGILSSAVKMVTAMQTAEVFKILVEDWDAIRNELFTFDLWTNQFMSINMKKARKIDCPSCGEFPSFPFLNKTNHLQTTVLCGRDTIQIKPANNMNYNLEELALNLKKRGHVKQNNYLLHFKDNQYRFVVFQDGRTLIHGAKTQTEAKSIYQQYFG